MTTPAEGDIWRFPYLWLWQKARGESEGRKDRPVAVVLVIHQGESVSHLILLALTTTPPDKDRNALRLPRVEAQRVGLDGDRDQWVILDEYNHDILQVSSRFSPAGRIGHLSPSFLRVVRKAFEDSLRSGRARKVSRTD